MSGLGTSQSSKGPLSNVSLVPPWVDDIEDPADAPADETLPGLAPPAPPLDPIAQPRRFAAARSDIGSFAKTGNSSSMRRGLGHYVREGYGGSGTFTRRLSGTARTASALDSLLGRGVLPDGTSLADQTLASGGDVNVVLDAVVDAVREPDGTQDAESSRRSIRAALSELLERYPDAELGALTPDQRSFVIERYASLDVYGRFLLDMQASIREKAGDLQTAVTRLRQIKAFINETVAAAFRAARDQGQTTAGIAALTRAALRETFRVFEEYL